MTAEKTHLTSMAANRTQFFWEAGITAVEITD